jgi:hypothetical protein
MTKILLYRLLHSFSDGFPGGRCFLGGIRSHSILLFLLLYSSAIGILTSLNIAIIIKLQESNYVVKFQKKYRAILQIIVKGCIGLNGSGDFGFPFPTNLQSEDL